MTHSKDIFIMGFAVGAGLMVASYCIISMYQLGFNDGQHCAIVRRTQRDGNVLKYPFKVKNPPALPEKPEGEK